jgi:hypothetical protein
MQHKRNILAVGCWTHNTGGVLAIPNLPLFQPHSQMMMPDALCRSQTPRLMLQHSLMLSQFSGTIANSFNDGMSGAAMHMLSQTSRATTTLNNGSSQNTSAATSP